MNLKEAFRYQNFLDRLLQVGSMALIERDHCMKTTKHHLMHAANPDVDDRDEVVETEEYPGNDVVLKFLDELIEEKQELTDAIEHAKRGISFNLESAIASNKYRQKIHDAIKVMVHYKPGKQTTQMTAYKFNTDGNQVPYYYDVEVETEDSYNRENAKKMMRELIADSDKISTEIDTAMINTTVIYTPVWDVNETFDEIIMRYE